MPRFASQFCLSLDNPTGNTSSTAYLSRWSEVVPPKTALTFAALWDPDEGMVTFSGAELLESESLSGTSPDAFDDDDESQLISVDRDTDEVTMTGENTATLATFQDAFNAFLHRAPSEHLHAKPGQDTLRCMQTRASSTFDGLDVYSHDIQLKPKRSLQLSCMNLLDVESTFRMPSEFGRLRVGSDLMLDSCRSDSESDLSSGSRPANLVSPSQPLIGRGPLIKGPFAPIFLIFVFYH
ncbi:hypothetical protein J3R82DRAFT_6346 [Butyriboletus roseoflavus]|nr:hypothetical protein J3R82DRAFT_6346 [Butyriboletus roseoflavus]